MKVLQINAVNGIRSTGRTKTEIADWFNQNGHEGYVAYSGGLPYKKGYKIGSGFEKKLHALLSRALGKQAYFSSKGTRRLIDYTNRIQPDVVHLGNLHGNFIHIGMLLEYLAKNDMPTVLTLHDCWFYTGKCSHYTVDNCYRWKIGCGKCPRLKKDNNSWIFDCTAQMLADKKKWFSKIPRLAVIGVSDWITNEAKASILKDAKIITKIYNWIDLNTFKSVNALQQKQELGIADKFVVLGVSSGWSNSKGLDSFKMLSEVLPKDMVIVMVGAMKTKTDLNDNVIHISETHDVKEMATYYSMADVFLNLSKEESFGKVTAEALACGTPVIALNSTANPELVGENCGYVLENTDLETIINALKRIKEHGKDHFSPFCTAYAKEQFNMEDRISDTLKLYQRLIELKVTL